MTASATRAAHHARPPSLASAAPSPALADQLRCLHEALIAYGFRLDYEIDAGKLNPATAQSKRHRARHGLLTLARIAHAQGIDITTALPPTWQAVVSAPTDETTHV